MNAPEGYYISRLEIFTGFRVNVHWIPIVNSNDSPKSKIVNALITSSRKELTQLILKNVERFLCERPLDCIEGFNFFREIYQEDFVKGIRLQSIKLYTYYGDTKEYFCRFFLNDGTNFWSVLSTEDLEFIKKSFDVQVQE